MPLVPPGPLPRTLSSSSGLGGSPRNEKSFLPSILIPSFDLGVAEVQLGRQFLSVLNTQVLLLFEATLQGLQLVICEGGPGLALLTRVHLAAGGRVFRRRGLVVVCN